jgi:hypothetical protein
MPVDYMPEAVRGDELLVAFGKEKLWVRPNGTFTKAKGVSAVAPKERTCNLKPVFGDSSYSR